MTAGGPILRTNAPRCSARWLPTLAASATPHGVQVGDAGESGRGGDDGSGRCGIATRSAHNEKDVGPGGPLTFVASTGAVDRHGDTVAPEGWRLDAYRENPVVLWAHDYRRPAIGRAQSVWRDGAALLARLEFAPTEFAREVEDLYRQGYQQGVSVGFRPLRFEERRDSRTGAFLGIRFLEQELLEISAVPVPANRGALMARRADVATEVVGLLRGLRP